MRKIFYTLSYVLWVMCPSFSPWEGGRGGRDGAENLDMDGLAAYSDSGSDSDALSSSSPPPRPSLSSTKAQGSPPHSKRMKPSPSLSALPVQLSTKLTDELVKSSHFHNVEAWVNLLQTCEVDGSKLNIP